VFRSRHAAYVTLVGCLLSLTALAAVPAAQAVPGRSLTARTSAPVVLSPAKAEGVAPSAAGVRQVLAAPLGHPSLGSHVGAYVYDVSRGRQVYARGAGSTFVPASTMKVLTTLSALATLGPDHRFTTKVVSSGASSIILVGGGDPLLASRRTAGVYPPRATLPDLAAATAKALKSKGLRSVTLGYDASLFSGPAVNSKWLPGYITEGIAAPTSALWVDAGRLTLGMAKRAPSPSLDAAQTFAAALKGAGISVTKVKSAKAQSGAATVAQVKSAPLSAVAGHVNLVSDNDGAEVLLRHVGLATKSGGSYSGGIAGVRSTLTKLGLQLGRARIEDGSGLSRTNAVPLSLLGDAIRVAASPAHPELRSVITGLPVAGFSGSLIERFAGAGTTAGSGYVRAKTGTLTGIHSLAGLVRDRTGTLLALVVATDSAVPSKPLDARAALDRAASAIAGCGCS
jgi:D-alanyl-D-alanine carboxypeptidase/D-alanyl-D-alanine-endopeptidase (penicillin-binding protein 4)